MYIGRIMHTELITVSPETSISDAARLIQEKNIDHLLVVDASNKLLGLLSDRDFKKYGASPATTLSVHELNYLLEKLEVGMIMNKAVTTIPPNTTIERAALIMQQERISSLPVMDNGELVGIITSTDVMWVLLRAIGISDDTARIEIFVRDGIGQLARVADIFKEADINILSLISWPDTEYEGITQLVLRIAAKDTEKAMAALQEKGIRAKNGYAKDISEFLPKEQ